MAELPVNIEDLLRLGAGRRISLLCMNVKLAFQLEKQSKPTTLFTQEVWKTSEIKG